MVTLPAALKAASIFACGDPGTLRGVRLVGEVDGKQQSEWDVGQEIQSESNGRSFDLGIMMARSAGSGFPPSAGQQQAPIRLRSSRTG